MSWESVLSIWHGNVTQYFGENKEFYKEHFGLPDGHNGIDISCGYGTKEVACFDSWVLKNYNGNNSDIKKGYGVSLITDIDLGIYYVAIYWHNQIGCQLKTGDKVIGGETIIGYQGNSGDVYSNGIYCDLATRSKKPYCGSHLHFGIAEYIPCDKTECDYFHPQSQIPIKFSRWIDPLIFINNQGKIVSPALITKEKIGIIQQLILKLKELLLKIS